MSEKNKIVRLPNKVEAAIPIIFLLTIMITNYALGWGLDPHIPVTLSCGVAMIIGKLCGYNYKEMLASGLEAINQSLEAIIIILLVGCLIGSFTACGTIPAVVYYGLKLFTPAIFLPFVTLLCAVVGIALGSAWTVSATLGIAFMAIGTTIFAFFSFSKVETYDPTLANELSDAIIEHYAYMSPILLIPILLIIVVAVIKMPAIPSVVLLSLIGCAFALIFQGAGIADCIKMLHYGYEAESGNALFTKLVNRGGMDSMLWTNNLVIVAVAFGGILQKIGSVESLLGGLIKKVRTPFQLVVVTIATSMFCITTMCDQYLGLIIPASMYKDNFDEMGLGRNMLSRTLEDGGTLWSPLIPWSSCGAYHAAVLGVPTLSYLPYCFMNIINPIYAILTLSWGGNILYADGSRTNMFGKLKKGRGPAGAPDEAYEKAMKALAKIRNTENYNGLQEKIS